MKKVILNACGIRDNFVVEVDDSDEVLTEEDYIASAMEIVAMINFGDMEFIGYEEE